MTPSDQDEPLVGTAYSCPTCSQKLDGYTHVAGDNGRPEAGDLTVCLYCSTALEFKDNGLAPLTPAQFNALPHEARAQLGIAAIIVRRARDAFAQLERRKGRA